MSRVELREAMARVLVPFVVPDHYGEGTASMRRENASRAADAVLALGLVRVEDVVEKLESRRATWTEKTTGDVALRDAIWFVAREFGEES